MEEKEDQSPKISPSVLGSNPSTDLRTSGQVWPLTQDLDGSQGSISGAKLSQFAQTESSEAPLNDASSLSLSPPDLDTVEPVIPEEEKQREVDLNVLFPGKEYDLNRLFPDKGTKKLLLELRRNKRDIQRFIKNFDFEEE
jgi:hypothetical protein